MLSPSQLHRRILLAIPKIMGMTQGCLWGSLLLGLLSHLLDSKPPESVPTVSIDKSRGVTKGEGDGLGVAFRSSLSLTKSDKRRRSTFCNFDTRNPTYYMPLAL
ncbi:hypothetical protein F4778DRAFT_712664, partial [Xylariomycetidae sp. FL2044]